MIFQWSEDGVPKIKSENDGIAHTEAVSRAGAIWKGMTDEDKQSFVDEARVKHATWIKIKTEYAAANPTPTLVAKKSSTSKAMSGHGEAVTAAAAPTAVCDEETKNKASINATPPTQTTAVTQPHNITKNERELYSKQKHKVKFATPEEEYNYAIQKEKECSKCNLMKNLTEYSGNTSGCDAFNKEGYRLRRPECKDCNKNVSKGKNDAIKLAKSLGIPYKAPEGTKCALCGKLPKKGDELVFDHCHKTNTFRGYLHNSCNRSMGTLGDDVLGLLRALNFLNKTEKIKFTQDINTNELTIIED